MSVLRVWGVDRDWEVQVEEAGARCAPNLSPGRTLGKHLSLAQPSSDIRRFLRCVTKIYKNEAIQGCGDPAPFQCISLSVSELN